MAKVLTFSRVFPAYHPKHGQHTYFVEKFLSSLNFAPVDFSEQLSNIVDVFGYFNGEYAPKNHTIRAGYRFKTGDYFSPRVWSGKPYNSKQIVLCLDVEVKKVWDFEITDRGYVYVSGNRIWTDLNTPLIDDVKKIANNDGLSSEDLLSWFKYPKPFKGQIICWNENINY